MTESLSILLVEDSPEDALLIREYLQSVGHPFELRVVAQLGAALDVLREHTFDAVLLDLALPDSSGLETFARLHLAAGAIPVIVLTGLDDDSTGLRAVQAGAEDYLVKGQVHGTLLWRSLRYGIERRRAGRRIEFQSQLLAQVGQAVVATDTDGVIRYWNAAAESLFGWEQREVIGQPLRAIFPRGPDEGDESALRWTMESWSGEVPLRRRDGARLLVAVTLSTLRGADGSVIGRVGISTDVTEKRAAEDAVRESEQRLRLFADVLPTIMWTTDTSLRITSLRGAGLNRIGDSAGTGVGSSVAEFAQSPDMVQSRRALEGEAVSAAVEWSGHAFDVHIEPLRDASGEIVGTIGIALDVTERRRLEQDAAQYFELLRTIVEAAPLAIIVIDENAMVSLWNRAAEHMFGWRSAEVLGAPAPHVPPDQRAKFDQSLVRVRHGARSERFIGRRITKDGRLLDVMITAAPVFTPDGAFHGTMGILEDVTRQRLAEERQQRLTAIIEASPDFVATFDVERRTLFINRAGRELIGLPPESDTTGTTLGQFCTRDTADLLERAALPHALREGTWSGEASLETAGGETLLVWLTLVAHRGRDDDLTFISAVAQDLSERRFLEDQLRQSQKMEAVGRLAGGVAHDFNNLLTAIAGHTELLLENLAPDSTMRRDVEEILRAVDRASTLTRQLLAFSRRQVLQPKLLDVNQIIHELGRLLRRLVGDDVELESSLQPGLGWVRADRGQVEQVVLNLVANARDALPAGGTIRLRTCATAVTTDSAEHRRSVPPGSYVEISVADNGTGMDEILMARIFEPFFTTREQGKGTGLGLATAYGIVTQSGGHVLVDSEPGAGSTFRVLLPASDQTAGEMPQVTAPHTDVGGSETVLLVEDEAAVRRLGCRILERKGYQVVEADSGATAIRLFEHMAPAIALLVTDVIMPGMSGSELARRLRAMKPGLPVLFTSGYTADAITQHGVLEPGMAFLEKPFTPDALAKKVRDVLDEQAS